MFAQVSAHYPNRCLIPNDAYNFGYSEQVSILTYDNNTGKHDRHAAVVVVDQRPFDEGSNRMAFKMNVLKVQKFMVPPASIFVDNYQSTMEQNVQQQVPMEYNQIITSSS
jgi:stress response protein SCP2